MFSIILMVGEIIINLTMFDNTQYNTTQDQVAEGKPEAQRKKGSKKMPTKENLNI